MHLCRTSAAWETLCIGNNITDKYLAVVPSLNLSCLKALYAVALENAHIRVFKATNCLLEYKCDGSRLQVRGIQGNASALYNHIEEISDTDPTFILFMYTVIPPHNLTLVDLQDNYYPDPERRWWCLLPKLFQFCFGAEYMNLAVLMLETANSAILLDLQVLPSLTTLALDTAGELRLHCSSYAELARTLTRLLLRWRSCNCGAWNLVKAMQAQGKACQVGELDKGRTEWMYSEGACSETELRACTCRACKECLIREGKWRIT